MAADACCTLDLKHALGGDAVPAMHSRTRYADGTRKSGVTADSLDHSSDAVLIHAPSIDALYGRCQVGVNPRAVAAQQNGRMPRRTPKKPPQTRPEGLDEGHLGLMAERLELWRRAKGWTQARVAAEAGVTRSAANHWFKGRNAPTLAQAVRLAERGGASLDFLFLPAEPLVAKLAARIASLPDEQLEALGRMFGSPADDQRVQAALGRPGKP